MQDRITLTGFLQPQTETEVSEEEHRLAAHCGKSVAAYMKAVAELVITKYAHISEWIPPHLKSPCEVRVLGCRDGLVITFDITAQQPGVVVGFVGIPLTTLAEAISGHLVRFRSEENLASEAPPLAGPAITFSMTNSKTGHIEEIGTATIRYDVVLKRPEKMPVRPNKPFCLVSIPNELELNFELRKIPIDNALPANQDFLLRDKVRLPVAWEYFEIYPFLDPDDWKPEYASIWAENDILAAVVSNQFREQRFDQLDPHAGARRALSKILSDFRSLLDSDPDREETLQQFLRDNPVLLCPSQSRGWPKLALGAHKTDFVFQEAAGDYLLVEIERSTLPLFIGNGHTSSELNHAKGQIADWKRYIEDNLTSVQREQGLTGISANPKALVVIGRSSSLSENNRRMLVALENDSPKLKVMTYDDVHDNAKAMIENLLGPITDNRLYVIRTPPGTSLLGASQKRNPKR